MEDNKKVKRILERTTTTQEVLIATTTKDVKENIKTRARN